jgi:hypothetical protein
LDKDITMRTRLLAAIAASTLILAAGSATAQPAWMSINERQARLDERIDRGVRSGALTQAEAVRLRSDFRYIIDLEARYRVGGLSLAERADLDRRFDELSARIRDDARDDDRRYDDRPDYDRGPPIAGTGDDFERRAEQMRERIDRSLRNRRISVTEAARLRADLDMIVRDHARYEAELDRRLDLLSDRIRDERRDRNY